MFSGLSSGTATPFTGAAQQSQRPAIGNFYSPFTPAAQPRQDGVGPVQVGTSPQDAQRMSAQETQSPQRLPGNGLMGHFNWDQVMQHLGSLYPGTNSNDLASTAQAQISQAQQNRATYLSPQNQASFNQKAPPR